LPETRVMTHGFLTSTAKCRSGRLSMANMVGIENWTCCCYCKRFSSGCAVY